MTVFLEWSRENTLLEPLGDEFFDALLLLLDLRSGQLSSLLLKNLLGLHKLFQFVLVDHNHGILTTLWHLHVYMRILSEIQIFVIEGLLIGKLLRCKGFVEPVFVKLTIFIL